MSNPRVGYIGRLFGSSVLLLCMVTTPAAARAGQRIAPPTRVKHVEPVYPDAARQARIQGTVTIEATIGADGKVTSARVVNSIPLLDEAALAAVRQWEYTPTIVKGKAQPVIMTVKVAFALAAPAAAAPAPPAGSNAEWDKLSQTTAQLTLDNKTTEAIALVEKFVSRNPNYGLAQYELAHLYEYRSLTAAAAARRRDLETAARHYAKASDLQTDPAWRYLSIAKLSQLYGPDDLNDPAERERYARALATEFPARAESHIAYALALRDKGDLGGAAEAIRNGRAAAPMTITGLLLATQYPVEQVQASFDLPREKVRALLDEAMAAADAIIKHPERSDQDFRLATMAKALIMEYQAERLAETRQQKLALLIESERWGAPIEEFKNGVPPTRKRTPAETAELEWRALLRSNVRLADAGRIPEAIASYKKYQAERPRFHEVPSQIAELSMRVAADAKDDGTRRAALEQAGTSLQQVIDLAPDASTRELALEQLLNIYGPSRLDQPLKQESAARAVIKREPASAAGHAALVALLQRANRASDAEAALRSARAAVPATAPARARLAAALVRTIRRDDTLPPADGRRLFDEANALLQEAERLDANAVEVIEGRMSWLNLSALRFETDPARAAAQREQAERLKERAIKLRTKGGA